MRFSADCLVDNWQALLGVPDADQPEFANATLHLFKEHRLTTLIGQGPDQAGRGKMRMSGLCKVEMSGFMGMR
jgi:hypothetical protein